jgi:pimeloyl-ACP methyl ester carboxylesterase
MSESRVIVLPDGRDLGWREFGDPQGWPILAFHGTPGSRNELTLDGDAFTKKGLRLICVDRPGYGLSSFQRDHRLLDLPHDVAYLADHLGIERFSLVGHSGGGPHALVCAAVLAERVNAVGVLSGVAPLANPRAFASMKRRDQVGLRATQRSAPLMRAVWIFQMIAFRLWPSRILDAMTKQLPAPDVEILARPDVRAMMVSDATGFTRVTGLAVAQDFELFIADWGFDLGAITVPTHLWHGDADRNVPLEHSRLLHEAIAGSVLHELPGAGHFYVYDLLADVGLVLKGS